MKTWVVEQNTFKVHIFKKEPKAQWVAVMLNFNLQVLCKKCHVCVLELVNFVRQDCKVHVHFKKGMSHQKT